MHARGKPARQIDIRPRYLTWILDKWISALSVTVVLSTSMQQRQRILWSPCGIDGAGERRRQAQADLPSKALHTEATVPGLASQHTILNLDSRVFHRTPPNHGSLMQLLWYNLGSGMLHCIIEPIKARHCHYHHVVMSGYIRLQGRKSGFLELDSAYLIFNRLHSSQSVCLTQYSSCRPARPPLTVVEHQR